MVLHQKEFQLPRLFFILCFLVEIDKNCILLSLALKRHILIILVSFFLQLEKCKRLIQVALNSLKEDSNYYYGIEACNEVLDGCRDEIGPLLSFECLCTRAAILLKVSEGQFPVVL